MALGLYGEFSSYGKIILRLKLDKVGFLQQLVLSCLPLSSKSF